MLTLETANAVGTDTAAVAEVKAIKASAQFTTKDFKASDPTVGIVASTIDLSLATIPRAAEVKIATSLKAEAEVDSAFQRTAEAAGIGKVDTAYVINIARTNIENGTDIKSAVITMMPATRNVT